MNLQKSNIRTRFATLTIIIASLTISWSWAAAMMLTLGGPSPESAYVNGEATAALYATSNKGQTVTIAQEGSLAPNGDEFADFGLPQVAPDGSVIFGAETRGQDGRGRWSIFRIDRSRRHLAEALEPASGAESCAPVFASDPVPAVGQDGSLVFVASQVSGPDVLVRYTAGRLRCVARVGDRTSGGRVITMLKFGSADTADNGDIVFLARVSGSPHAEDRTAVLNISPGKGINEIAVEGQQAPDGKRFSHLFGRPAVTATPYGSLVAFANRTAAGTAIFVSSRRRLSVALREGTRAANGRISYVSGDKPGLVQDGTIVARGAFGQIAAVLQVRNGEVNILSRQGDRTPSGPRISSFGEAQANSAGSEFLSAFDETDKIHFLFRKDGSERSEKELVWPKDLPSPSGGFLSINDHGDLAFLGPMVSRPGPVEGPFTISVHLHDRD